MTSILPHPSPPDPPVKQRYIEQGDSFSPSYFECKHPLTHFSSVQSLSHERLFVTPWIAACQASLSITSSQSLFKLMAIEPVMPSSHLILCCPLLLLPPISPSIRVFSSESVLCIRWPKYWGFSFSISPSNEYSGLISFRIDCLGLSRAFSKPKYSCCQFGCIELTHVRTHSLQLLSFSMSKPVSAKGNES